MGMVMARYVILVEPIASMTPAELARRVGPTIERYLAGDLGDRRRSALPGAPRSPAG